MPVGIWKLLHVLLSITFAASVLAAHWNVLAARRTTDWARRAALYEANHRVTLIFGLASLILLGLLGNLAAVMLGYRMASDTWLRWVNGLWLLTLVELVAIEIPATAKLLAAARRGVDSGAAPDHDAALARWRMSNGLLLLVTVAFVALMVFRWKS